MRIFVNALIVTVAVIGSAIAGDFIPPNGFPKYKMGAVDCPSNYETGSVCHILAEDFAFVGVYNGKKMAFQAAAGVLTDGASIPKAAQDFIGKPHDKEFSRAAVIHDHYVLKENAVYDYFLVQRVFYDILIESRVTPEKANAMYLAVLVFAPKWSLFYSAKPDLCKDIPDGVYCVRSSEKNPDGIKNYIGEVRGNEVAEKLYTELINAPDFNKKSLEELEGAALRTRALAGIDTPVPVIFGRDK